MLCTISYINPEKVSWKNICELASLFVNECYLDLQAEELFEKLDMYIISINIFDRNHDGFLNLNQLYNFISRTFHVWEPMYSFEMFIIQLYIPAPIFIPIFERKLNYNIIKSYQINHRGHFPPETCVRFIIRIFTGSPHHYKFDYECGNGSNLNGNNTSSNTNSGLTVSEDNINVSDLLEIMIQRYIPMHRKLKIQYNLKYLTCFTAEKLLVNKGNFYHKIFTNLHNEHSLTKSRSTSRKSNNTTTTNQNTGRSLLDMYSNTNNTNTNTSSTGSILRGSSNYRDRSSSLFQRQQHHHPVDLTINTNLTNPDLFSNNTNNSVRGCNCSSFNTASLILANNTTTGSSSGGGGNKGGIKYKENGSILINNSSDSNEKKNSNKDKENTDDEDNEIFSPKLNSNNPYIYYNNCAPSPPRYNSNNTANTTGNSTTNYNNSLFVNGSHRIKLSFQASALLSSSFNETPVNKNRKMIQTPSPPQQPPPPPISQQQSQLQQQSSLVNNSPIHTYGRVINVPGSTELDMNCDSDDNVV